MSPQHEQLVANYLTRMAYDATADASGNVRPERFMRWRQSFAPVLNQFPLARRQTGEMSKLLQRVQTAGLESKRLKQIAENRAVTTMISSNPEDAISRVFASSKPINDAALLKRLAGNDVEAQNGLKQAFLDWFHAKHSSDKLDSIGSTVYKAEQMNRFLKQPRNRKTMEALGFTQSHLNKLTMLTEVMDKYNKTLATAQTVPRSPVNSGEMTVFGLTINSILSRFYAIKREVVSPRFVASEMAGRVVSRTFNSITQEETIRLVERAFVDPVVLQDLLTPVHISNAARQSARLRTHLISMGWREEEEAHPANEDRPVNDPPRLQSLPANP